MNCKIVLPSGTDYIRTGDIPELIAKALNPEYDDVELSASAAVYDGLLHEAIQCGELLQLQPHRKLETKTYIENGKVPIECFIEYAKSFYIDVFFRVDLVISEAKAGNHAMTIPGKLPRIGVGKLAVQAAYEIETETGRAASSKDVLGKLQRWANDGKYPDVLIRPVTEKRAVVWRTGKGSEKEYDTSACSKTIEVWMKSRR